MDYSHLNKMKDRIDVLIDASAEEEELVKLYLQLFGNDELYRDYRASQEAD